MIHFSENKCELTYVCKNSINQTVDVTADYHITGYTGKIAAVCAAFATTGNATMLYFYASETAPSGNQLLFSATYTGQQSGSWLDRFITNGSYITADADNLNITTYYNQVFGTSKTRQEVFAELQRLYGDTYVAFGLSIVSGTVVPAPGIGASWNFKNDPSATTFGFDSCDDYAYGVVDSNYLSCFTGDKLIDPDYAAAITGSDVGGRASRLAAYLLFAPDPVTEKLRFNVYLDGVIGQKGPNIAITWTNTAGATSELSNVLIKPHIWTYPCLGLDNPVTPTFNVDVIQENGITVPNDSALKFNNTYNWDASMQTDYIGMADRITSQYNMLSKVTLFGIDGIPNYTRYFLRFDYTEAGGDTFGDLWYVDIPYEYEGAAYVTPVVLLNSSTNDLYDTEVIVIGGTPPEEPEDDPDSTEPGYDGTDPDPSGNGPYPLPDLPDITGYESTGYPGQAVLTKTYKMTSARLQNLGNKLWTQSYFDVLKVQSNPIENIIACRWYPMSITTVTADQDVVVGDVNTGVKGDVVGTTYRKTIGTYKYTGTITSNGKTFTFPGYLGYSPFTTIKLYLPYVGVIQLDATEIYNRTLSIEYIVDLITGDLIVFLKLNGFPYMNLSGKMGVDIPLSGTDRAQVQIASASRALTATIGAAGHLMSGDMLGGAGAAASGMMSMAGLDYSTQRVITHSSVCASYENRAIIMEIQGPKAYKSDGYAKQHGFPSNIYTKITKGMGFIKVAKRSVINVAMSDTENRELEQILTSGCYF